MLGIARSLGPIVLARRETGSKSATDANRNGPCCGAGMPAAAADAIRLGALV
jgi:hypothetical protein